MTYNPKKGVEYAEKWAFGRNPAYYDFDPICGDCTNFVSQCLFTGCGEMNYTPDTGWYYHSLNNRSPAWTGVEYLHRFLTSNTGAGPRGLEQPLKSARVGDIIQLCFDGVVFGHSLFVVGVSPEIRVAAHSDDSFNRPLNTYQYQIARLIQIEGVR